MSINFSELVILLLPGFLGLWVYKRIVQEDIDKRSESTQIAIGLLLGISAFCMLFLINKFLSFIGSFDYYIPPKFLILSHSDCGKDFSYTFFILHCFLRILLILSEYISPAALKIVEKEGIIILGHDYSFWSSYMKSWLSISLRSLSCG